MNSDIEKVLYNQKQLDERMNAVAAELNKKYKDEFPIVISVLTGAMIFTSDMVKRLNFKLYLDLIKVSSYQGTQSTGKIKINQDIKSDVKGRRVIVMEDIVDTGRTLKFLTELLKKRGAKSVDVVVMLDKPMTRTVDFQPNYYCYQVPDAFLVGYGLDYNGVYRNLPYIGILKKSVYSK